MLEGVKAGNYFDNTYIPIRATTPPALIYWAKEKLGDIIDDNPFMMSVSKAYASMARAGMDVDGNPHELSVPDMIALIEAMGDPQYIVFQTSNNRYVEVVSFVTESKKKVFAVIEIGNDKDTIYMNGYEGGLYNVLVTAYPPDAGKLQELLNHPKNKVIYDKQKDVSQRTSSSTVPSVLNDTPFFEDSITQPDGNFKENSEKKSERDNSGNQLTVEQAEYFKDSKVRDKNGNLMVMYHGTPNATFTKFKSGTYFTEHKEYADNYQNQGASSLSYKKTADNPDTYAVYLNITKPFDTRNKVERDIFYNEYYRQWGTGTDLMESGLPDWLDGGDLQEFLEEKGYDYDGLILDEGAVGGYGDEVISRGLSYVTFKPEQVKSVENKTPTDDSDYRFSYREELDDLNTQLKEKQNQIYSATMELKKFDSKAEQDKLYAVMDKEGVSQEEIDNALQAYSKWSTDSGYDDAFKKQSTLKDEERTLRREIQKIEDKLHDELKEQISHFSDEDVKKYVTKAVQKYHTTSRLENASYLLTTGSMLDFSDGQGYRVKDHREISEILDLPDYAEYSDGMIAFMNMGNIRLQTYGIDVSAMPNSKQFSALRDIISKVMREYDEFSVDFSKTDGYSAGSVTYGKGTATSKIVADIKSFFETGVVPEEQTGIRDFLYSMRDTSEGYAPAFYSKMGKTIDEIKQNKIGASSVIPYLTGKGVKAEEIKWSGIETFLEGKKSLTKEELQEFVKGSQLQIEESVLDNKMHSEVELKKVSKRKYDLYVDGKKTDTFTGNWKGDYWTTENSSSVFFSIDEISKWAKSKHTNKTRFQEYKLDGGENYRELLFSLPESSYTNLAMSAHWKQRTGILAHARIQDFDVNGKKMLFVEEIQSDWHNEGHKHGYREKGVKTQEEIGDESAKAYREFYEAVEGFIAKNGESVNPALLANLFYGEKEAYDFLQTNYNLSEEEMRYIDSEIAKETNRSVKFDTAPSIDIAPDAPFRDNYHEYVLKNLIRRAAEEGYDLIGWTPANIQSERWSDEFAEGYRIEYDQDIPKFLKKYGKQWGTTVGTTQIETGISSDFDREMAAKGYIDIEPNYTEVWSMDITDSMKNSVLYEGQVMYQERDPDAIAAYEKVVATLETENAKLTEDVERLKELVKLQRTETHNKVLTKSSVDAVAKSLMKYANAKGNRAELVKHLEDVYSYILQGENVSWEGVMEKAENAVDWLVRNEHIKTERDEYANTILKDLRTSRFYLDDLQKKEVAFRYGSYNEFRKKTMGRFILTDNAEMSLDSQWQVWAENYPGKFDASESSNNQPLKLMDIIDGLQEEIPVDYYGDAQMNRQDLLMSVYDGYWNVSTLTTFADRKQKEINNLKYKHKEQMSKLREDHNDKTLQLKKEYNEKLAKVREKSYEKQQAIAKHYQDARKKGIEDRNKTKVRGKIKSVVNELDKLLMRGNKDSNVKEDMQDVALAMLKSADAVFSTSFSNKKIVQGDISQMVLTAKEKNLVENYRDALESIDKTKAKIKELNESGTSDSKYLNKLYSNLNNYENLAKLYDNQLEDVFERERIRISKVTVPQALKELADAYKSIQKSEHAYISNVYNSAVAEMLDDLSTDEGMNRPFKEMSLEQLSEVYDAYKMVLTTIRDANKLFAFDKAITVEKLGMNARSEIEKIRTYNRSGLMRDFVKKYGWDALKPIYAFRNIGSDTLENLYRNIRKGEDVWYRDSKEAQLFQIEMKKNYGFNSWDLEKTYHFVSNNGKEFSLTLEQIMSLYALSRREQSLEHLIQGGIVLEDAVEVKESKTGKTYKVNTANTFTFSPELLNEVTKVVRENENMKGYVESMQEYLTKMGDKGNEVSMKLFGVRLFKEKVYFPIKSSDTYMNFKPEDVGEFKIKNSSFTKSTKKYANNPIVLNSFESVWGDHINDMALYHAFTLPLEDFTRVFNYRTRVDTELGQDAVRGALLNAYGKDAETYIRNLLKDLNGGVRSQNSTGLANKLISLGKKSSVFASASVTVQQPSAIARAFAHINPKYFANLKQFDLVHHNKAWEELKQYAPVAGIKEMGYFDTGLGQSSVDWIMQNNPEGFREGIKAFFSKDSAYRDEILSKAPALADELTWVAIWEATKKEVAETYDKNADDYLDKCGERFTEVIELTQVYDSVFSRSGYMRSKDVAVKMAVAFMAEPTTTMNMVYDSFVQNHRKTGKSNPAKVIPAVVASVFLNALLKALVTSGRDDDEDEAWIEKYLSATANSFVDDINPLTYIPYVKDVWSIFTGYDINRMDMSVRRLHSGCFQGYCSCV